MFAKDSISPEPLGRREWVVFWLMSVAVAATRLLAVSRTLWDWDEAQFVAAVEDYDVRDHRPHPTGFPAFILLARAILPLASDAFRALQTVTVVGAILLFPAVVYLALVLGYRFRTAITAGVLCAFFPNVWFFGGTAFSDVPAIVAAVGAIAFLLRGERHPPSWIVGCLLAGLAVSFRPQNLLVLAVPAMVGAVGLMRRNRVVLVAGVIAGAVIVAGSYAFSIRESGGLDSWRGALEGHRNYIVAVDSFRNPDRPPVPELIDDFFVKHYGAGSTNWVITFLVVVALLWQFRRSSRGVLWPLLFFAPVAVVALFTLDYLSRTRFSIGYIPLLALLAAAGTEYISQLVGGRRAAWVQGGMVSLMAAVLIGWTLPALKIVRRSASPPVAAAEWIRANAGPDAKIVSTHAMKPFRVLFPGRDVELVSDADLPVDLEKRSLLLREGPAAFPGGLTFARERGRLRNIVRRRYFEVSVVSADEIVLFGRGWHDPETDRHTAWRWMSASSTIHLPPNATPCSMEALLDTFASDARLSARLNGRPISPRYEDGRVRLEYEGPCLDDRPNLLELSVDRTGTPSDLGLSSDARELGARLDRIRWRSMAEE